MGKYKDLMFKVATIVIVLASLAMVLIIYISLERDVKENDRKSVILITPNKIVTNTSISNTTINELINT